MKRLFAWALKPQSYYTNLDMISHIEDDYYHYAYTQNKDLTRFYLAQV